MESPGIRITEGVSCPEPSLSISLYTALTPTGDIALSYQAKACPARWPWVMLRSTVSHSILHRRIIRSVALLLMPLFLFAQGLRLCLHTDTIDHAGTLAVHLESNLSTAADHDISAADVDISLAMLVKAFYSALIFTLAFALIVLVYLPRRLARRLPPPEFRLPPSAVYHLTPPLRAPPR